MNVAVISRKQVLLCRGNQRFRGKNAEGLLGLPRFPFLGTSLITSIAFCFDRVIVLLRPRNIFIKFPKILGNDCNCGNSA